jgi:hypothetical protein
VRFYAYKKIYIVLERGGGGGIPGVTCDNKTIDPFMASRSSVSISTTESTQNAIAGVQPDLFRFEIFRGTDTLSAVSKSCGSMTSTVRL